MGRMLHCPAEGSLSWVCWRFCQPRLGFRKFHLTCRLQGEVAHLTICIGDDSWFALDLGLRAVGCCVHWEVMHVLKHRTRCWDMCHLNSYIRHRGNLLTEETLVYPVSRTAEWKTLMECPQSAAFLSKTRGDSCIEVIVSWEITWVRKAK